MDYEPSPITPTRSRVNDKCTLKPGREAEAIMIMSRRKAHAALNGCSADLSKDICKKCGQLACKCQPDKLTEECKLKEIEGGNIVKNIANAC